MFATFTMVTKSYTYHRVISRSRLKSTAYQGTSHSPHSARFDKQCCSRTLLCNVPV